MSDKKKMAFVDLSNFKDWPMGGMLEYELAILKYLTETYEVDIWGVSVDGKANHKVIINEKSYPIHIWGNVKTGVRLIPNYYRGLMLYLSRKKFPLDYDVVYAHTGSCVVALKHMIDREKTVLVYQQHGINYKNDYSLKCLMQRPFYNISQRCSDLVLIVSDEQSVAKYGEKMRNRCQTKFVSVGSPINLSKFDETAIRKKIEGSRQKRAQYFIYTGRLTKYKNVKVLISSMRKYVADINPQAVLYIVGDGEEFADLKRQISLYKLENHVKLLGSVNHEAVYDLLRKAEVFLTASNGEGVSVSVLEAFASGLPVVCFKVSGLEGQVKDGITGVFAEERNADAFFDAMVRLDSIRAEAAFHCLEEAKKYDSVIIARKIESEINKVIKNNPV